MTPKLHKELTRVDNGLILENYVRLHKLGKDIFVRIPVVGGANLIEKELELISEFLKKYPPKKVEPLPYHTLGEKNTVH